MAKNVFSSESKTSQANVTFRRYKKTEKFTTLPNAFLRNSALSFEARGMLAMMLSLPPDWSFNFNWLMRQSPNTGRYRLRTILKDLKAAGYIQYHRIRTSDGRFRWEYIFDENPLPPEVNEPPMAEPPADDRPIYKVPTDKTVAPASPSEDESFSKEPQQGATSTTTKSAEVVAAPCKNELNARHEACMSRVLKAVCESLNFEYSEATRIPQVRAIAKALTNSADGYYGLALERLERARWELPDDCTVGDLRAALGLDR